MTSSALSPVMSLPSDCRLVSSQCDGELDTWFLSPTFPCRGKDKRIGDIVMQYLCDEPPQPLGKNFYLHFYYRIKSDIRAHFQAGPDEITTLILGYLPHFDGVYFYSEEDVIAINGLFLGEGRQKIVHEATSLISGKSYAALIAGHPGGRFKAEFDASCKWRKQEGHAAPQQYYQDDDGREFLLAPKYDMTLLSYLDVLDVESRGLTLKSFQSIALGVLHGLESMENDGRWHDDLFNRNMLVNCDASGEVLEAAICDYGDLSSRKEVQISTLVTMRWVLADLAARAKVTDWPIKTRFDRFTRDPAIPTFKKLLALTQTYFNSKSI